MFGKNEQAKIPNKNEINKYVTRIVMLRYTTTMLPWALCYQQRQKKKPVKADSTMNDTEPITTGSTQHTNLRCETSASKYLLVSGTRIVNRFRTLLIANFGQQSFFISYGTLPIAEKRYYNTPLSRASLRNQGDNFSLLFLM